MTYQGEGGEGQVVDSEAVQVATAGGVVASEASEVGHTTAQEQMVTSSGASQVLEAGEELQTAGGSGGGDALETMSVVESLVKLSEKQPVVMTEEQQDGDTEQHEEVGCCNEEVGYCNS